MVVMKWLFSQEFPASLNETRDPLLSIVVVTSAFYGFESNNQYVLPNAIVLLKTTACGVDLVYWILWLSLGKLVLVGHSS